MMIIGNEARELFRSIQQKTKWVRNIWSEIAPRFETGTMRPEYVEVYSEAIAEVEETAEKLLLENNLDGLMTLERYIDTVHTEAIDRTQTRYIGSKRGSEAFLEERRDERERYGFYENGSGLVVVENGTEVDKKSELL